MRRTAIVLLVLAGLLALGAGARYLLAQEFMAYHAVVSGKAWLALEPGVRTIVTGMLHILGAGFLACGVALLALAWGVARGHAWAGAAALLVTVAQWAPTLQVTLMLRDANPAAQPPMLPSAAILLLGTLGGVCGWLAARDGRSVPGGAAVA